MSALDSTHGAAPAPDPPPPAPGALEAVLLATAPSTLRFADATLLDRLRGQLASLGARSVRARLAAVAERLRARRWDGEVDACALLLVGLVRAGAHVSAARLRGLTCERADSAEAVTRIGRELAAHDEDRVRLDAAVKA